MSPPTLLKKVKKKTNHKGGVNGIGTKAITYTSSWFQLELVKDGKFYIAEMIKTSECIFLTEEEFTRKYPTRIEELSKFGFPALKRYKELK